MAEATEQAPSRTQQDTRYYTPAQKYTHALQRLEELKTKRETLTGAKNKKKRTACNKKIKALEDSLEELEAMTTAEKSLEWRIRKLTAHRETLTGASNKKKRSATNKKLKALEQELHDLKNGPSAAVEDYDPPLPEDWLSGYRSPNPEKPIRVNELKQYEEQLTAIGAKRLCEMTSLGLKNELGITNGKHRNSLLTILADLKHKVDWMPQMKEPLVVQTLEYGDGCTYPQPRDELHVLYRGTLRQNPDVCFDSNLDPNNPFRFHVGVGSVIMGWDKGLMKMSLLEKARLTIAARYAYGPASRGQIPSNSDLVFEVTLLGITRNGVRLEPGHALRLKEEEEAKKREEAQKQKEAEEKDGDEKKQDDSDTANADATQSKAGAGATAGADELSSLPFAYNGEDKTPSLVLYLPDVPQTDAPNYFTEPLLSDKGSLQKQIMTECDCNMSITSLLKENFDQARITLQAGVGQEENILKAAKRLVDVFNPIFEAKGKSATTLAELTAASS